MQILPYCIAGLVGAASMALAVFLALLYVSRRPGAAFISFSRDTGSRICRDCELLEYGVREGGVYVKVRNNSAQPASMFLFTIKAFTADARLVDQVDAALYVDVEPGQIEEAIVKPKDYTDTTTSLALGDRQVQVKLKLMYIETQDRSRPGA